MDENVFEILKLILQVGLIVLTGFIVPALRRWILTNTTKEQRKEAVFWIGIAIKAAEDIYKVKGAGKLKKEWVLEWCKNNNINFTAEQLGILIDLIVGEFNKNGWDKPLELSI